MSKGIFKRTKKHCENISKAMLGIKKSKKHCENMSISAAKRIVRDKLTYNLNFGKSGWFFSKKNNKMIHFQSDGEKQCIKELENNNDILNYEKHPLQIPYFWCGSIHNYVPDFLVKYKKGKQIIIEVKQEDELLNFKTQAKIKGAIKYCKQNNIEYRFYFKTKFFKLKLMQVFVLAT